MNSNINKTTETDFFPHNQTTGTLFSSHTVKTLSLIDLEKFNNNNYNNNNHEIINDTTNNTNTYKNHRNRHFVNSTELAQNFYPLNTTPPLLPNIITTLPLLQGQQSVHFNTEPIIVNTSSQTASTNHNIQLAFPTISNFFQTF